MIDAVGREWLHNGNAFYEKMVELNLAYSADLVVADATKIYVDRGPTFKEVAEPGIIIVGSNRVAADAACVALMKRYGVHGVSDEPVLEHEQFAIGERIGLGSPRLDEIDLRASNLSGDENFDELISGIRMELTKRARERS
jgi:uncharacterized protein (DUF362 family)